MTAKLGFILGTVGFVAFFTLTIVFLLSSAAHAVGLGAFAGIIAVVCLIMAIVAACYWYDETNDTTAYRKACQERLQDYYERKFKKEMKDAERDLRGKL